MNAPLVGFSKNGERITVSARNDAGASIPYGTPVTLSLDGTEDGLAVVLPSGGTSQALCDMFFYGVATDTIADGNVGKVQMFGIVQKAILVRATRSDDSADWVGSTSLAQGVLLSIDTVNNCFSTAAATGTMASATTATTIASRTPFAFLANDVASFASTASTGTVYGTALTVHTKAFVRAL